MDAAGLKGIVSRVLRLIARTVTITVPRLNVIALVLALGANVAAAQVTVSLPDTIVSPSTSVSVPVRVTGFYHVGSFSLTITFDKTVLTYTGVANQPASGSLFSTPPATANSNGSVSISWFNPTGGLNIGSGTLLNVLFTYGSGSSALSFTSITPSSITDSLATNIPASFTNGRVRSLGAPPSAPSLSSPSNGATNQATSLTLSWNPSSGATSYRLQVSTDPAFVTTAVDDSTLISPSRLVSSLTNGTTYYWRVSAASSAGKSAFSSAWSFTTIVAVPGAPSLVSPANGSTGQPISPILAWNASTGATTYRLQVAADSTFASVVFNDSTLTVTQRAVGPFSNNAKYYWRVNATNVGGTSQYSPVWSFTTIGVAPSAPGLISPNKGATGQPIAPTLTWSSSTGATSYRLQIATDSTFASIIFNDSTLTVTQRVVGPLSNNVKYYWRVNATNAGGTSQYSTVWNFTTIVAAPGAPSLLSPADNAINLSLNPALSWNSLAEATSYELQVSLVSSFATFVFDDTTSGLSQTIGPLNLGTNYFWKVRARNAGGFGGFSSVRTFKTILTSDVENPDAALPREFALSQNYPNPFNPSTIIGYDLPARSYVTLVVYNSLGQEVARLVDQEMEAGHYVTQFDATALSSSVFFYRLQAQRTSGSHGESASTNSAPGFLETKRMILLR